MYWENTDFSNGDGRLRDWNIVLGFYLAGNTRGLLFSATPMIYVGSQARDQIQDTAVTYITASATQIPLTHYAASWNFKGHRLICPHLCLSSVFLRYSCSTFLKYYIVRVRIVKEDMHAGKPCLFFLSDFQVDLTPWHISKLAYSVNIEIILWLKNENGAIFLFVSSQTKV